MRMVVLLSSWFQTTEISGMVRVEVKFLFHGLERFARYDFRSNSRRQIFIPVEPDLFPPGLKGICIRFLHL